MPPRKGSALRTPLLDDQNFELTDLGSQRTPSEHDTIHLAYSEEHGSQSSLRASLSREQVDSETLALLSFTLENQHEHETIRRRNSQARVLDSLETDGLRKTMADGGRGGNSCCLASWRLGCCTLNNVCKTMASLRIDAWDKPILLITNACNYLWFLACYHIFKHYLIKNGSAQSQSAEAQVPAWVYASGMLFTTFFLVRWRTFDTEIEH
jgi:hypothetical protein